MLNHNHSPQEYLAFYVEALKCKDLTTIPAFYNGTLQLSNYSKFEKLKARVM